VSMKEAVTLQRRGEDKTKTTASLEAAAQFENELAGEPELGSFREARLLKREGNGKKRRTEFRGSILSPAFHDLQWVDGSRRLEGRDAGW